MSTASLQTASHCIPAQLCPFQQRHNLTVGVGLQQACVLSPLLFIVCTHRTNRRAEGGVTVGSSRISLLRMISCRLRLLNRSFNMHLIGFLLRAIKLEWILALRRPRYYMLKKPKSVHAASERQYSVAGREVQVYWCGIHEWWKAEQGNWCKD